MAIKIQCPGCSDKVVAEEADRGKSIKCGTCWTPVNVPAAEAGAAKPGTAPKTAILLPNPPAAVPLPSAPVKPGTAPAKAATAPAVSATVAAKTAPVAAAVVPAPVVAVPVPPAAKPSEKKKKEKEKPRFKERKRDDDRDDDDDDDDDTPRKKAKKGNAGLLIGLGVVALVLVAGCGGLGFYLMKPPTVASATSPGDGSGGGGDDPAKPKNWRPIAIGDGFAMDTPNGDATKSDANVMVGPEGLTGKKYWAKDANSSIQITAIHCDLKPAALRQYNPAGMALAMFPLPSAGFTNRGKRFVGDQQVDEFSSERPGSHDYVWIARITDRAYGIHFHWENPEPAGIGDIREAFFRSLAFNYVGVEPFDPQPWNPGGNPIVPRPDPAKPAPIEVPWVALANKAGFSVEAPKGVQTEKVTVDINGKTYGGRKYWTEDAHCIYAAYYHDIPADSGVETKQFLAPVMPFAHTLMTSEDVKIDGKPGSKWSIRHIHGGPGYAWSVRSDFRVFSFVVTSKNGIHDKPDATHVDRADILFKSIKITFDPKKADLLADEPAWVAMTKTVGFTALAPKGTAVNDHSVGFARDAIPGKEYKCGDDGMDFYVYTYDLPPGKTIDKVVTEHVARNKITDGPKDLTIDGYGAEELTFQDVFKLPYVIRSVKVGNRAIILKVAKRFGGARVADMEYEAKKAKFFANFHIGNGGAPVIDNPGVDPMPGAGGEFVKAAKILPFWAATVLPEKKEVLTFSVRDPGAVKPGGTLRRYSYPDFKLKATYQLALPVNRAVADEKTGRLYCASVTVYDKTFLERELSFAQGDIQIFDLNKLLDGKLAELEDVKPLNTITIGTRISGLEISPKDPLVYVSAITMAKDKGKTIYRGRLYKIDTEKQKIAAEIDSSEAIWSMRLSADGDKLAFGEMPLTPAGQPLLGVARPTNVVIVDPVLWKRTKNLPLPAAPVEIALVADRVLAVVSSKAEPNLLAVDDVGDVADLTPRADAMTGARYIRTTGDGKKLLISGGIGTNTAALFDVAPGAPPRLVKIAGGNQVDTLPLGGHFIFSQDGKYAIFNTGLVIDLEKTAGKK